jgi:hypothetical protein
MDDPEWVARNEAIKQRIDEETQRRLPRMRADRISGEQFIKLVNDALALGKRSK